MFYVCVQRFDGMDEIFLGGELNRALQQMFRPKIEFIYFGYKVTYIKHLQL